ncbi:potassium voltage-gated channel subfamily A member 7-like isoform X4 [Clytia hemisphaerica]|uniref:Uncharacterized protein n=1 Tax=Clytia hemisphaerica TaxID=252671 RepID=A0A7M5TZG9_9CNID
MAFFNVVSHVLMSKRREKKSDEETNGQPPWSPVVPYKNQLTLPSKERLSASTQDLRNGNMLKYYDGYPQENHKNHNYIETNESLIKEEDLIRINVCGMIYETLRSTLQRFPDTLLGDKSRLDLYYVKSRDFYYFDKNRQAFEAILYYYQTGGILIRPPNIPMPLFAEEVAFFDLGESVFMQLQKEEGYISDQERVLPTNELQRKVWELFEFPDSSQAARILATWSVLVIILSITVFCLETLPQYSVNNNKPLTTAAPSGNVTNGTLSATPSKSEGEMYRQPWFSFELGCIIWFSFEYLVRLLSSPSKWQFAKSFLNTIDLLAILPYFITLSINSENTTPLSVLRVVRLVRVFRIFKLSRHSLGLRILGHTLRASISELGMLIFFLCLGVILFSSAIFYAEQGMNDQFQSIPDAFWYSLVTMTTVGYGDKVPKTLPGKFVGSLCAIVGVLTIALPVPVIVSNFEFFYKRDRMTFERSKYNTPSENQSKRQSPDQSPQSNHKENNINHNHNEDPLLTTTVM